MIVILCDTYDDAKDAFDMFCSFCERYEPFMIEESDRFSLRVSTDDDLVYIFTDYRFKNVIATEESDVIEVDEFFFGLYSHYDADVIEDFHYGWFAW